MKYIVISANRLKKLTEIVNVRFKEGYKLKGGIAVGYDNMSPTYCQAMIKRTCHCNKDMNNR